MVPSFQTQRSGARGSSPAANRSLAPLSLSIGTTLLIQPSGYPSQGRVPIDGDLVHRIGLDVVDEALLWCAAFQARRFGVRIVDAGVRTAAQHPRRRLGVLAVRLVRPKAMVRVRQRFFAVARDVGLPERIATEQVVDAGGDAV